MKIIHRTAVFLAGALLAASLLAGCGAAASSEPGTAPSAPASSQAVQEQAGAQTVQSVFTVTYADGTSDTFTLETEDGARLSDALRDAGLISEEEAAAGFVTAVNGVTADWDKDGAWWCLTDASGEMTAVGVADIALHDGDSYAFTYTAG